MHRRFSSLFALLLVVSAVAAASAMAGTTTTTPAVDPATSVYVEQVPTAKGSATANGSQPGDAATSSGGSGLEIGIGVAVVLLVSAGAAVLVRRRHNATRGWFVSTSRHPR